MTDGRRFDTAYMFGTSDRLQRFPVCSAGNRKKSPGIASAYTEIEPTVAESRRQIAEYQ